MLETALIMKDYMDSFCNVPSQVSHKYVHTKQKNSFVMQNITLWKNIIFMKEFFSILERPILIVALLNYRSCRKLLLFHIVLTCPQQRNQSKRRLEAEVCKETEQHPASGVSRNYPGNLLRTTCHGVCWNFQCPYICLENWDSWN